MKKILLPLLVAVAMVGCSKEQKEIIPQDNAIQAFVGIEAGTKAVVTAATGLAGVQFIKIDATAAPSDFTTGTPTKSVGAIAATSGEVTFNPVLPYESVNDHNAYIIGYYPAGTLSANVVTWNIDGKTDILRTDAIWDAGKYSAPKTTGMKLNHQLSQVDVVCKAEAGVAISAIRADWGKIKSISFKDAPTTMVYSHISLGVANGAVKADLPLFADYNGTAFTAIDVPEAVNATANAMAMVAPVTAADAAKSFEIVIVTEGKTADAGDDITKTVAVKVGAADAENLVKGKKHIVTLTFKLGGKNIESNDAQIIDDWTNGSTGAGDVAK